MSATKKEKRAKRGEWSGHDMLMDLREAVGLSPQDYQRILREMKESE